MPDLNGKLPRSHVLARQRAAPIPDTAPRATPRAPDDAEPEELFAAGKAQHAQPEPPEDLNSDSQGDDSPGDDPAPTPPYGSIDGAAVLDRVEAWYRRFIRVTFEPDYHLLALWTVHTHLAEECYTTPRLQLDSLVEEAGKSTVLDHLKRLGHDPIQIASLSSPALLPRLLHKGMRTILLDEVHRTLNSDRPGIGDLVAIINTGYRVGATRPVNVQVKGGRWEPVDMPTFASTASSSEPPNERGVGVPSSRSLATTSREANSVYEEVPTCCRDKRTVWGAGMRRLRSLTGSIPVPRTSICSA
jgi:hypothetical protein